MSTRKTQNDFYEKGICYEAIRNYGSKEWYQEEFKRTPDEGLDAEKEAVAKALLSVMYGDFRDRKMYEAALSAITGQ